ncbi:hypothetical protein HRbin36_01751 [bacterium HR36]|nr:hypothetical protein HRbin36_01751 [bacterium HR36]
MNHLLIDGDATTGGKGDAARVAFEQWLDTLLAVELLDSLVNVHGTHTGLGHLAGDPQRCRYYLARLTHLGDVFGALVFDFLGLDFFQHHGRTYLVCGECVSD